jgi:flavin-dependent dehydrogenase
MADYQAVIVGAGAGGPMAAYVLASRGWKVALLEKGRNPTRRWARRSCAGRCSPTTSCVCGATTRTRTR